MRKHMFMLPKQVSKYNKNCRKNINILGGTALCKQSYFVLVYMLEYTGYKVQLLWDKKQIPFFFK